MSGANRPIRALVVEDERPAQAYLVEILQASGLVDVIAAVATLDEALEAVSPRGIEVDVAFVDINLATSGGERAGMALTRALSTTSDAPSVVLTTALKRYAVEAFELGVVDYLLKPFSEERVHQCINKLQVGLSRERLEPPARRVVARSKRGLVFLKIEEVWAFEASRRLTFVHTPHDRYDIDLSLTALETSFGVLFARAHRNWLVNKEHINALEREDGGTLLLVGSDLNNEKGIRVPVSKDRAPAVRQMLLSGTTGIRR